MQYSPNGSGANDNEMAPVLTSVFFYTNAIYAYAGAANITAAVPQIVNADLDAGCPVLLGIYCSSTDEAHEIVCDGYGYDGNTLYHHLNLGWSGEDTAWYNLPNIGTSYEYNVVDSCTYNIYPSGSGEVISGRALDGEGNPVAGAVVTAVSSSGYNFPAVTTNARGIYALAKVPSATTYTLTATYAGLPTTTLTVTTGTSTANTLTTGNVWGANIRMAPPAPELTLTKSCTSLNTFAGATATYTLSYGNTGNAAGSNVLLSDPLPATLSYVPGSASDGGSYTPATSTLTWALGSLPVGQSGQVTFQVTVNAGVAPGTEIVNTASIGATEVPNPVYSNNAVMLVLSPAQGDWWMFHHDLQHSGRSPTPGLPR